MNFTGTVFNLGDKVTILARDSETSTIWCRGTVTHIGARGIGIGYYDELDFYTYDWVPYEAMIDVDRCG